MKRIISVLFLLLALTGFAYSMGEYDGYIVELKENSAQLFGASLFAESENTQPEEFVELLCETDTNISEIYAKKNLVKVKDEKTLNELIEQGLVEYYEPDLYAELFGYDISNNPEYINQTNLDAINFEYAYEKGIFGEGVRVGVIDSGVYSHADIEANLEKGYNYFAASMGVAVDDAVDNVGHGSLVSSIIAASNNNRDIVGVAHKASIVPFMVCDEQGKAPASVIIASIYNAVDNYNCDVINMSLGIRKSTAIIDGVMNPITYTEDITKLKEAVDHAIDKGCLVIAASGNDGAYEVTNIDPITGNKIQVIYYSYPAAFENVVSVANLDTTSEPFSIRFSSTFNDMVDIAAPGTAIIGLDNARTGLTTSNGTSFSSPHVAGVAALAKEIDPDMTQAEFVYYLKSTANSSLKSGEYADWKWGAGYLDVKAFIDRVLKSKEIFVSEIDVQDYGNNTSVYLYNPNDEAEEYTVLIENQNSRSTAKTVSVTVGAKQTKEISLTQQGFSGNVSVKIFDKDDTNFENSICERQGYIPLSGDINGDGVVNIKDAIMLSKYLAELEDSSLSFDSKNAANVYDEDDTNDIDNNINIKDAILLSQFLADMDVSLPER